MTLSSLFIYYTLLEVHQQKHVLPKNGDFHNYPTRSSILLRKPGIKLQKSARNKLNLNFYNILPQEIQKYN